MALNDVALASRALIRLGAAPISSFNDGSAESEIAGALFGPVRDALLSAYGWSFATGQQALSVLETSPLADYANAFTLPDDFLRAMSAGTGGKGRGLNYRIARNALHTDASDVLLTYIFRPEEEEFPPYFDAALIVRLSAEFCIPVTENTSRAEALFKMAEAEFERARQIDAQQDSPGRIEDFQPYKCEEFMTRIRQIKTTFTAGEISRTLLGRGDLRAYENGALTLRNVFIQPTGGVTRRAGLRFVDNAAGNGRLMAFEFSVDQTYLLVLTDESLAIYVDEVLVDTIPAPWTTGQISQVAFTQSADTLLMVHPDVPPKKLTRNPGGIWLLQDWEFFTDNNIIEQPYFKFSDNTVTLTPSGTTGTITLTSSANVFTENHEGTRLRVGGREVEVTDFNSTTVITVDVIETLSGTSATIDWEEQAFSAARGYPISVAFHQDRLVIGGSRDLPNRLWFSKSGDLFNFDLGTGLDDEAIEFSILSDQVNAIRGIFSGRHLQIFTSGAEWMVTGDPLTPVNVQIRRQTRVGSMTSRYIAPVTVDGATLFVARNGEQIQEFLYTDVEQAYQVTDLALVSRHIIPTPADIDFDQRRRLPFLVREDGKFATLTVFRSESVAAWTLHETAGEVKSVSVVGDDVYLLIHRTGEFSIECIDDDLNLDAAMTGTSGSPAVIWSGLDHLEGETVTIVADGIVVDPQEVEDGQIILEDPASFVEIGLPYTHVIEPLPPSVLEQNGAGRAIRLIEAVFRIEDTAALRLDVGRGLRDIPLRQFGIDMILDEAPPRVSRDVRVHALGWQNDTARPLWRIEHDMPLPFTLLSVTTELKVND